MAIKIISDNGLFCVHVFCDWCGNRIDRAIDGNYEWEMDDVGIKTGDAKFTHKECCRLFENAHGGRSRWCCEELEMFPVYLNNNLKIDKKHQKETEIATLLAAFR